MPSYRPLLGFLFFSYYWWLRCSRIRWYLWVTVPSWGFYFFHRGTKTSGTFCTWNVTVPSWGFYFFHYFQAVEFMKTYKGRKLPSPLGVFIFFIEHSSTEIFVPETSIDLPSPLGVFLFMGTYHLLLAIESYRPLTGFVNNSLNLNFFKINLTKSNFIILIFVFCEF